MLRGMTIPGEPSFYSVIGLSKTADDTEKQLLGKITERHSAEEQRDLFLIDH